MLSEFFQQNPQVLQTMFDPEEGAEVCQQAVKPANWKRVAKFNPTGDNDWVRSHYSTVDNHTMPAEALKSIRVFYLRPDLFEDAVGYMMLEARDGTVSIGEYVGD
jgi:hypothetical protein